MKIRAEKVLRTVCFLLCAGLLYAFFCRRIGSGVPCPVYALTGFRCPGCGMSRMCLALLRGDWREAFRQNRAALLLLPAGAYIASAYCTGYIRRGERVLHGAPKAAAYVVLGVFLAFGLARNFLGW